MASNAEIAKAYVQIIPSVQGIQGKLGELLGNEAGSAGEAAGTSLVGKLKGAIASAGIGAALTKTIMEGANLEQSLGGVETLFANELGDASATAIANAEQAYRTAGLSANDYMQTVTSVSAALLNSLGGDTAAAAKAADTAVADMSDNANKMGSDMSTIMATYQSLARGNYAMLDNLKLGYGGTKTEMERLLKDAQELSGVEYDISSLSDVYEAIHVIQTDLGITGTTAKEAASTISGSAASMKAAFSNVLGNLTLGRDIGPSLQALADTVKVFLWDNLRPAILHIVTALPGAAVTFLQAMIPENLQHLVVMAVTQLSGFLQTQLPQLLQSGSEMLMGIVNGLLQALPALITAAGTLLGYLVHAIVTQLPQLLQAGYDLLLALVAGIKQSLPAIWEATLSILVSMTQKIVENLPLILETGITILGELAAGLIAGIYHAIEAIPQIFEDIRSAFGVMDWQSIGDSIIQGIIVGLKNAVGALWQAATEIAGGVMDALTGTLDIHSPSGRAEREVGYQVPAGVAVGAEKNIRPVTAAMKRLGTAAGSSLHTALRSSMDYGKTTPVPVGPGTGGMAFYQTINTHDKLSPAEMTREAEDFMERSRWKNP